MRQNLLKSLADGLVASLALLGALAGPAAAEDADSYPSRPVRVIIPYPPGGGPDSGARPMMERLTQTFGQSFVIEYRSGAAGTIGTEAVAKAAKDGYTLLVVVNAPLTIAPHIRKLPYDPLKDFAPIAILSDVSGAVAVPMSLPVKTWSDFVGYAKANRGKLQYGSSGVGSITHMRNEMINRLADLGLEHVPYKGSGEAVGDLIAGHIHMMSETAMFNYGRSGQVRLVMVLDTQRHPDFPDVPTAKEAGLDKFSAEYFAGLLAPAGTPQPIIAKLNAAVVKIGREPEMMERLAKIGQRVSTDTPEQFEARIHRLYKTYGELVKEYGIQAE